MIGVQLGDHPLEVPYTLRLYGLTEEQFDELVDEDTRADLLDGVMIVHSPASLQHDDVGGFLRALMSCYADARQAGSVLGPDGMVQLAPGRRVAADIFYLTSHRLPRPRPLVFRGVPDLMAEILSPSNREYDLNEKRPIYRQARVPEAWFVDLERRVVLVDRLQPDGYTEESIGKGRLVSSALHGFWVDVGWLWTDPLPNRMTCLEAILAGP